jgi:large subunit ribosomal protein L6
VSRVGRKPIPIVKGVTVTKKNDAVVVKGPKGELSATVHPDITIDINQSEVLVSRHADDGAHRALHGLWRALIQNMINGVTQGYSQKLEIVGVGYRAEMKGHKLQLMLGYSHPILFGPPEGVKLEAPTQTSK